MTMAMSKSDRLHLLSRKLFARWAYLDLDDPRRPARQERALRISAASDEAARTEYDIERGGGCGHDGDPNRVCSDCGW